MGKLTGFPNAFTMSFLVVGTRGNFFCQSKDLVFFFGRTREDFVFFDQNKDSWHCGMFDHGRRF